MPANPTYPGVYLEEPPSGAFTVVGVSTSVTAFVGRTVRGPVNTPTTCFSFADYVRRFGGQQADCPVSYAVEDFFTNGGGEAIIVRARPAPAGAADAKGASQNTGDEKSPDPASKGAGSRAAAAAARGSTVGSASGTGGSGGDAKDSASPGGADPDADKAKITVSGLTFRAADPGDWGNRLTVRIDRDGVFDRAAAARGGAVTNTFNLTVFYTAPGGELTTERFAMLTTADTPRRVDRVLKAESLLVSADPPADKADVAVYPEPPTDQTQKTPDPTPFSDGAADGALGDEDLIGPGASSNRTGLYALEKVDAFNILCIPPEGDSDTSPEVNGKAAEYCSRRSAIYVVDGPRSWTATATTGDFGNLDPGPDLGITDEASQECTAVYFPRIMRPDPARGGLVTSASACGVVAGQMARNDVNRGVWKAPAGVAVSLGGVSGLEVNVSDGQQGQLNPVGVNCLRNFRVLGPLVWGARTLRGSDALSSDYKYLPVRRLTHYIEESLIRALKSAVFEPNDEALWSQIRLMTNAFMGDLARQGAFYNYQVICDAKTTTPYHIDRGICVVQVAFAPVKPAEFIVLQIQQQQVGLAAA